MASLAADGPDSLPEGVKGPIHSTEPVPDPAPPLQQQEPYTSESSVNVIASDSPSHSSSYYSSDSDEPHAHPAHEVDEDAACDVVGVSIGRQQSRMKARATPAEEKNRVLEAQGGYFTEIPDTVGEDGLFASEITAEPVSVEVEPEAVEQRLLRQQAAAGEGEAYRATHRFAQGVSVDLRAPRGPSGHVPTKSLGSGTKQSQATQRSGFTRSLLKTSLPSRPRAWSGELKKFLPDLGSLTKRPSLSFRHGNSRDNSRNRARSQTVQDSIKLNSERDTRTSSLDRRDALTRRTVSGDCSRTSGLRPPEAERRNSSEREGRSLHRSTSDRSLYLRASSAASSLDQRPLYENVHSQVNSRFKAIKDSFQDSSSRLLSMPTLHLGNDWGSLPSLFDTNSNSNTNNGPARTASPPPAPKANPESGHPILDEAMSEMIGDVVILGGYRGSILRSAKPPHRQLWVPIKVGLNLRKVDLEVGLTREDEERMEETIIPSGVLSHVGPVDICRRLMKRLRKCENSVRGDLRVWDYGYDWRLSPEMLSANLINFLESLPCNNMTSEGGSGRRGAIVVAHSLGGLITRHAVNKRPELFAGVVYAGVPQHCVNILGPLRFGDDVLISSRVLTAQVNFTFRTSFALLPDDGHCFIDKQSKEEFPVDFFDPRSWEEHRLSPCIGPAIQPPVGSLFKDLAQIGKRFSLGPRDDLDINDPNTSPTDDENAPKFFKHAATMPIEHSQEFSSRENDGIPGPIVHPRGSSTSNKTSTTSTIPRAAAMEYLERTLAEVKRFKKELEYIPTHGSENRYPPASVIYTKNIPTVYGARVVSRESIKQTDCYDDLAFAAGDGVCLATAAMLPPGYRIIKDGLVKSDRGHVGLLGDLEGVGQCLRAIIRGRKEGVGLGN
ncbi:hypothetical protein N7495_002791 [Penicillium taxi]|uniref:uncharacterized protein n=1 Tax=Penicillium taxi TaxID=168475 RepID=UPI0025456CCB|nr:uncharacterized protein N7495_002791 [Penicillium taxi]KAJ5902263.1 hypothetical protein N7495_002791 [Penicillium taxi]